jgi:hypothetical protein
MEEESQVLEMQLAMDSSKKHSVFQKNFFPRFYWSCFAHAFGVHRQLTGYSFWSYELCKRLMTTQNESSNQAAMKVLLCGGVAGIVTWGSVFPLDMIKTRLQAQTMHDMHDVHTPPGSAERQSLVRPRQTLTTLQIAKEAYRAEGLRPFYRGLGICSIRAFIVNAVQVSYFFF